MNIQMQVHIELLCFVKKNIYLDSFGVEYIPNKIKDFIKEVFGNKNIKTNIYRVHEDNSIMCRYFWIRFIDFMLAGKKLTDFQKNDNIMLSYFKNE